MNNLIINGIDHSKFDLEWAKRGGVVRHFDGDAQYLKAIDFFTDVHASLFWSLTEKTCQYLKNGLRMATPSECAEAGIEYIEPPARWLPIYTLTTDIPVPLIVCDKKSKERGKIL